ncbi:MAG: FAD:protein FMN transferase [Acholeplasmataceae bacterium]|nr:FAD:protein FMN transferase [Acholeplasmataceae bacterium]
MKKTIIFIMMLASILGLASCQSEEVYTYNYYDYMDTFINVSLSAPNEKAAQTYQEDIDAIFSMYHDLSTSYEALDETSSYMQNITSINQMIGQRVEIDQELYDLLMFAEEVKVLTDDYFDISIGKAVDVWKNLMTQVTEGYDVGDLVFVYHYYDGAKSEENKVLVNQTGIITSIQYDENNDEVISSITVDINEAPIILDRYDAYEKEVSDLNYQEALDEVALLDFSDNQIILESENDQYYVTIHGDDIKLDLGAIAKGYATQKAADYIEAQDINYYSIVSGSSSIILGENKNRPDEDYIFKVSLANPVKTEITDKATYGTLNVKNLSITTSGNYEQYVLNQGYRYHHIVSPITKAPTQFYHTVTVLGQNAGLLDGLSTALFSMSPEVLEAWLLLHQEDLDIELVIFNQEQTITTYLQDNVFEEH